jgi:riboflavin synthase alpha subunit
MPSHGRFDGHIVQGHVDDTAICNLVEDANGSWRFRFKLNDSKQQKLLVQKVLFVSMGLVSLLLIAKRIGLVWPLFLIPLSIQILIHSKWQPRSISNLIL